MQSAVLQAAHADAWEVHGRYRESMGGGASRLPGIRLMASGLAHPQWNGGDVVNAPLVDIASVREWFDAKGVPWGVRVPRDVSWPHGRYLLSQQLMGVTPTLFQPAALPHGVVLRRADPEDVDAVMLVDTAAFGELDEVQRPWLAPILAQPSAIVCIAEADGVALAGGHCVLSDGDAGPAAYLAGIGVVPAARRRGIGAAVSSWLIARGFANGARLAHLFPENGEAERVYSRLGFVAGGGFDVYVDI